MTTTSDALLRIADQMDKEANDDMPMQSAGFPTVYADIRKWAAAIRAIALTQEPRK